LLSVPVSARVCVCECAKIRAMRSLLRSGDKKKILFTGVLLSVPVSARVCVCVNVQRSEP